jgi:ribosomal protein L4
VVVDTLANDSKKTKDTAALLKKLGATGKTLLIAVSHDVQFTLTARNIAGVTLKPSARVTARDVMDTDHVIATREALEKLQESLA